MHFSTIFAVALAGVAAAKDITVGVSNKGGDLVFVPDNIKADVGDNIMFKFWPKNHSVSQATFAAPCEPMAKGFWSGYVPTTDMTAAASTTFMYTVKDTSPVWFYCSQGKHCQSGMVGVINQAATGNKTIDAFKAMAKSAKANVGASSAPGTGGMLMANGSMAGMPGAASAASSAQINILAFTGAVGMFAYMLL